MMLTTCLNLGIFQPEYISLGKHSREETENSTISNCVTFEDDVSDAINIRSCNRHRYRLCTCHCTIPYFSLEVARPT